MNQRVRRTRRRQQSRYTSAFATAFPIGNPTIVFLVCFFSGIQLLSLGIMGEYVGRIYDEVRHRPKYILESRVGWPGDDGA